MVVHQLNCKELTTEALIADIKARREGVDAGRRLDGLAHFVQKGAIICLAGILPLAAAREYTHGDERGRGDWAAQPEISAGPLERGAGPGPGMDLSTLQDLVSGVGVILANDFTLPQPQVVSTTARNPREALMPQI